MRRVRLRTGPRRIYRHIQPNPTGLDGRPEIDGTMRIGASVSRDRRRLVRTLPAEDVVMLQDDRIPPRLTGRDVAGAWIIAALLFLVLAAAM